MRDMRDRAENSKSDSLKVIQDTFKLDDLPELPGTSDYSDEPINTWAKNVLAHIDSKQKYLLGYRGESKPDSEGRTRSVYDKKAAHDSESVAAGVSQLKSEIKKLVEDTLPEDKQLLLLSDHQRLFKSVKGHSVLFLSENLFKSDNLSEKRKRQAFKNSFGKHVSGVSTGDTPILDSEDEEDTKKSLRLYVSV